MQNKNKFIENKLKEIENNNMNNRVKSTYRNILQQKKSYQIRMRGMKNKEGENEYQIDEIKTIWAEHFYDMLYDETLAHEYNEDNSGQRRAMEDLETIPATKFDKLKEVIINIRNGKSPDSDNIQGEMLKAGGRTVHKNLYRTRILVRTYLR